MERLLRVTDEPVKVSTQFHATSAATWRRRLRHALRQAQEENGTPVADVDPAAVNRVLRALEGKHVDMYPFARDTPPGKGTVCRMKVARAFPATLPARTGTTTTKIY